MKIRLLFIVCLISLFVGCSSGGNKSDSAGELHLFNWGDYIDEELIKQFEAETGITVKYENFDSNETMYAKIKNGGTNYDLCIPSDYMIERMIKEDMLEKINFENIPNFSNISDRFKSREFDPRNEYSVPYMWGTLGILYNTEMVDETVDSWEILWNPKYEKNIYMYDSVRDSFAVALKILNHSLNTVNPDEIKEAEKLLLEQKPLVLAYYGDQIKEAMIQGEAALSVVYSGDAMYAIANNPSLNYVLPKEGTNGWYDAMVIPKNAKNKENAEKFINFICDAKVSAQNSEYIGFSTTNEKALEFLPDDMKNSDIYWPSDEEFSRCEIYKDLGQSIKLYDDAWTMILAEQ